jgi:hypothetical protein
MEVIGSLSRTTPPLQKDESAMADVHVDRQCGTDAEEAVVKIAAALLDAFCLAG